MPGSEPVLRVEFPFVLPRGLVDDHGAVHAEGIIRLATARDEIQPQGDPRVRDNPAYLVVLVLARTVLRIGAIQPVDTGVIERLFASDLAFLQNLYRRVNRQGHTEVTCSHCGTDFAVNVAGVPAH